MASLLLPSRSSFPLLSHVSPWLTSSVRCSLCCPISLQVQGAKCGRKLYMMPGVIIARLRSFAVPAMSGSAETHGTDLGTESDFSSPFTQRPGPMLDSSSLPLNNANDFEKQMQELFDEVKTLISTGKKSDAIDLLQANYHAVKDQIDAGFSGIEETAVLDIVALGYIAVDNMKMVGLLLDEMNKIVDHLDDDEILLDSILLHMGSMYSALGNFEKSILVYERALKILDNVYGKHSIFHVTPLLGLAKVVGSTGKAMAAAEIYERVIAIMESDHGVDSIELVLPLACLGNLLLGEGKVKEAEHPFTRIVNLYSTSHGVNDGRVGMALCSLAHVKCAQGDAGEAIHLYRKALQVVKDSGYMELDDSIMEKMRVHLAELLHIVGRGNEGRELLEECLVITEKYKGKYHPSLAMHYINLAASYSFSKNYVEAERLLRVSLRIMMKSTAPDDPSITFPKLHLAVTLFNLQRDQEAERLAVEVLRTREAAFGKESPPVGEALDCLVSIQTRLGEDDSKLLKLLMRVLRIQEKEFGFESEEVMVTLNKIIIYLDKLGKKQEKFPLQRRLSVLRDKSRNRI